MKPDRKQISAALIEHLDREELHSGEAAKYLNLNPCYISMAKSEKSWDAMSTTAWNRLEEWFNTRENIKDFKIPEGEEIWKKPERDPAARITEPDVPKKKATGKEMDEHSPANLIPDAKKEKPGKSVKLVINQAEIDALRKDIEEQKNKNTDLLKRFNEAENYLKKLASQFGQLQGDVIVLTQQTIPEIAKKADDATALSTVVLKYVGDQVFTDIINRIEKLEEVNERPADNGTATPKGLVIFQRNYFKS